MRIIKRKEFLAMPPGTLFSKYKPSYFGELCIKEETRGNDFLVQEIAGAIECTGSGDFADSLDDAQENGTSIPMDFDCLGRDGFFEPDDQLFAVWEPTDVRALIVRLQDALKTQAETGE